MKAAWRFIGGNVWGMVLVLFSVSSAGAEDTLVLDESVYFRHYYQLDWDQLSAEPLKADGEKLISKPGMERLEREVKARLKHLNIDWKTTDWRDQAVIRFACPNAGIQPVPEDEQYMNSPPPPANWMKPDFNDSEWLRQRKPFLVGRPSVGFGVQNCGVRTAYYRTRFFVPDPAKAGAMTLKLTFRGGARVFVNGQEVGRKALPAGEIAPNALGDEYPLDAYIQLLADFERAAKDGKDPVWQRQLTNMKTEFEKTDIWPPMKLIYGGVYVAELYGPFEDGPRVAGETEFAQAWGNEGAGTARPAYHRSVWSRIQGLRERVLGPLVIPAAALRKGDNVLAIEVHAAPFHPIVCMTYPQWAQAQISFLELKAAGDVPGMAKRPPGMQVWVEDPQHQVHDTEWGDYGAAPGTVRLAGVPGGTYGGQIVVGTDQELDGLAATASELKSSSGTIPASAQSVVPMRPVKVSALTSTIGGRSKTASDPMAGANISLIRHSPVNAFRLPPAEKLKLMDKLNIFDQVGADGPRTIPADRCQPLWVSLAIPVGTPPGLYRGSVKVAAGGQTVSVPVEAEVFGWRLGEPRDFQTLMALEFSPYAVAKQYKTQLWSDEHLQKLVPTLKLLSRVGNGFVFVPVVSWTEFGNRDDSCIRWIRRKDGVLTWDYSRLDKFLDLCARHMGDLRCVTFVVMNGNPSNPGEVMVDDEASGKREVLLLQGAKVADSEKRRLWGQFAVDLFNHMKARGQEKAMTWGYAWDSEGDSSLKYILAEFTPGVYWAMGGHDIRVDPKYYKVTSWIYKVYGAMSMVNNRQGWKNPALEFQNPRGGGSVMCLPGPFPAFAYRLAVDRALTVGCRGLARVGVDYWQDTYFDGARGGEVYLQPGMPVHAVFWPGPNGAESSTRFESMAEAVQESEARIFIEQAIDRKVLTKELADKAAKVIFDHLAATSFIPAGVAAERQFEYGALGWRERSRRLYGMAAEIASALKVDAAETTLTVNLAPRSKPKLEVHLRNWTGAPRSLKAGTDQPWIVPEKSETPVAPGFSAFGVILDGNAVEPGKACSGTLTLTDTASGRSFGIAVTAEVSQVYEVSLKRMAVNLTSGRTESRTFSVINKSGAELSWKAAADAAWLKLEATEGKLPAATARLIAVQVVAPAQAGSYDGRITVTLPDLSNRTVNVKMFSMPAYAAPAVPPGEAVNMDTLDMKKFLKRHDMLAANEGDIQAIWFRREPRFKTPSFGETGGYLKELKDVNRIHGTKLKTAMWVVPRCESVYNLKDSGFRAFSASVGVPSTMLDDALINFEIYVDGQLRAQSNLMTPQDAPRLLTVDGLDKASELMLVTRTADLKDDDRVMAFWADPKFYR